MNKEKISIIKLGSMLLSFIGAVVSFYYFCITFFNGEIIFTIIWCLYWIICTLVFIFLYSNEDLLDEKLEEEK